MFVTISLAYFLWYTLLAMFSCSAVIQSIISYLTSKKKILHVKLIISHLFHVEKKKHGKQGVSKPICILVSGSEIVLIIYYLSNDDDTGTRYSNDGAAPTKNSQKKFQSIFCTPPLINVSNVYKSTAELRKSFTKIIVGFLAPPAPNQYYCHL